MNLPMRQTKKRDQALDAVASLAKTWSEWRLGDRAVKSVEVGKKKAKKAAKQASKTAKRARKSARKTAKKTDVASVKSAAKGTPLKVAGAVALVGGVGAAVAKKLKGGGHAEPLYTPPPAPDPIPAPEPTPVVVDDLAGAATTSEPETAAEPEAPVAVAASESAVEAATEPAVEVTEPVVPGTDPEAEAAEGDLAAEDDGNAS